MFHYSVSQLGTEFHSTWKGTARVLGYAFFNRHVKESYDKYQSKALGTLLLYFHSTVNGIEKIRLVLFTSKPDKEKNKPAE